jgi:hypothetical protein
VKILAAGAFFGLKRVKMGFLPTSEVEKRRKEDVQLIDKNSDFCENFSFGVWFF